MLVSSIYIKGKQLITLAFFEDANFHFAEQSGIFLRSCHGDGEKEAPL